jgi:dethiobiotin synthetase
MKIIFITGIDTGVGKTVVTGLWAHHLLGQGRRVLTAKLVQTGSSSGNVAEDIQVHRTLMGSPVLPADQQGWTCPYVLRYPAAPHLAARLENRRIDPEVLDQAWERLSHQADWLLLEGVGGIEVPLREDLTTLDYLAERRFPTLVVTCPRLGSLNHTFLTVDRLQSRGVPVLGLAYNLALSAAQEITRDTRLFFQRRWPKLAIWEVPPFDPTRPPEQLAPTPPDFLP